MKNIIKTIAFGAILITSNASFANLMTGWGTEVSAGSANNCTTGGCSSANGGDFSYNSDGGQYTLSSYVEHDVYGYGRALADYSGLGYLPTLKVIASSTQGNRGSASAFAIQRYTYTGSDNHTIDLNFNLHGSISKNNPSYFNQLRADVGVLIGDSLDWYPDFATLFYELAFGMEKYNESLFISSGNDVNESGSISFDINDGQSFYIVTYMGATAFNGTADAWNTLTMSFDDLTGLSAAATPAQQPNDIPLPATWISMLLALGLMTKLRKK